MEERPGPGARPPAARRGWVVDPSFTGRAGRHGELVEAAVRALTSRGLACTVLAHHDCEPAPPGGLPVRPVFTTTVDDAPPGPGRADELAHIVELNGRFGAQLHDALAPEVGATDVLVCPELGHGQLLGLGHCLSRLPGPRPMVVVGLPAAEPVAAVTGALTEEAYVAGFGHLLVVHPRGVHFLASTAERVVELRTLGAWSVQRCARLDGAGGGDEADGGIGALLDRVSAEAERPPPIPASSPAVSVVMAVRDAAPWVGASMQAILAQREADFELCILDEGSSDDTCAIVASFADPRVRLQRRDAAASEDHDPGFNTLIGLARANLVAVAEVCDVWDPDKLQRQIDAFAAAPELDVCFHNARFVDGSGAPLAPSGYLAAVTRLGPADFFSGDPVPTGAVMFRKDLVRVVGLPPAGITHDYAFWMTAALLGARFLGLAEPLMSRRPGPPPPVDPTRLLTESLALLDTARRRSSIGEIFPELECCDDPARSVAFAHFDLGLRFFGNRQLSLAAADFEWALRMDPTDAAARNNLGVCLVALGASGQGIELITEAAAGATCTEAAANSAALGGATGTVDLAMAPWGGRLPQIARLRGLGLGRPRTCAPAAATLVAVADDADLGPAVEVFERVAAGTAVALPVLVLSASPATTGLLVAAYDGLGITDPPPGRPAPVELLQIRPDEWAGVVAAHLLTATEVVVPPGGPGASALDRLVRSPAPA